METYSIVNNLLPKSDFKDNLLFNNNLRGRNILYLDDEYVNYLYFSELLSDTGVNLIRAFSAEQALMNVAVDSQICLVIISESINSGIHQNLISQIRSQAPKLPIVGIIGLENGDCNQKFLQSGCDLYINRHIDNIQLIEMVDELLQNLRYS